jgi:succinate dehydrogenase / fumarate reductase cytochrome b subunit
MQTFSSVAWSSVGRKLINGLTGLMLVGFILIHMAGNLVLILGGADAPEKFNKYSHFLLSLGTLIYIMEIGLILVFLFHLITAVRVWWSKRQARPDSYAVQKTAGGASQQTIFSKTMIYTGTLILIFVVTHVAAFKYGASEMVSYGELQIHNLYKVVQTAFSDPLTVVWYEAIMLLLGFHLRHGFWSAFQSLGVNHPRYSPVIFALGKLIAVVVAVGFLSIPLFMYFTGGVQ